MNRILDMWLTSAHRYFKLSGSSSDDGLFIITGMAGAWYLLLAETKNETL